MLKEKQEAERKKIEAEGISSFQKIVTERITENLLKMEGDRGDERIGPERQLKSRDHWRGQGRAAIILGGDTSAEKHAPVPAR